MRTAAAHASSFLGAVTRGTLITFSTVHVAKGLSWKWVALLDSFFLAQSIGSIDRLCAYARAKAQQSAPRAALYAACHRHPYACKSAEELVNMCYVAITRAEEKLYIPRNVSAWLNHE